MRSSTAERTGSTVEVVTEPIGTASTMVPMAKSMQIDRPISSIGSSSTSFPCALSNQHIITTKTAVKGDVQERNLIRKALGIVVTTSKRTARSIKAFAMQQN